MTSDDPHADAERTTGTEKERGWAFPGNSRKAHYFNGDGRSLCHKWGFYTGPVEDTKHESADNCVECKRLRVKLHA